MDGDPGNNKSSFNLDLASRVSTGRPMPDGSKGVQGGVLLLLAEDSISKTVQRRLDAAGADMNRIAVMNGDVMLSDKLATIQTAIVQLRAKLLIVDPFMAYLAVDGNKEQRVRKVMGPLKRLAEETNIAVVLVRHMSKAGGRNPLYPLRCFIMNDDQFSILGAQDIEFEPVGTGVDPALECRQGILRELTRVASVGSSAVVQEGVGGWLTGRSTHHKARTHTDQ